MISQNSTQKLIKFDDVKSKLEYEWKNIFRSISSLDIERKGIVNINTFYQAVH